MPAAEGIVGRGVLVHIELRHRVCSRQLNLHFNTAWGGGAFLVERQTSASRIQNYVNLHATCQEWFENTAEVVRQGL